MIIQTKTVLPVPYLQEEWQRKEKQEDTFFVC